MLYFPYMFWCRPFSSVLLVWYFSKLPTNVLFIRLSVDSLVCTMMPMFQVRVRSQSDLDGDGHWQNGCRVIWSICSIAQNTATA